MLKISQEISRDFAPSADANVSELVLLPVDPYHLYAYWNLHAPESVLGAEDAREGDSRLTLRIYWRPDESVDIVDTKLWFDVPVQQNQNQCRVPLPIDETRYSAAIGRLNPDHTFTALAHSNSINVPRGRMAPDLPVEDVGESWDDSDLGTANTVGAMGPASTGSRFYDEALILWEIEKALSQKSLENYRRSLSPYSAADPDVSEAFNERRIDFEIKKTLFEKGIKQVENILRGAAPPSSLEHFSANKTASGQRSDSSLR